ncbi:hypothetical protein LZ31DRAFT_453804, partial [Colletotrichum somersetense]
KWTYGKEWGPARKSGPFTVYCEITYEGVGLIRQLFSICSGNKKHRIVSFYSASDPISTALERPSTHPEFGHIKLP